MRSIKKKLVLYLGILIAVICGGLGVTSYIAASNSLISNLSKTLPEIAEQASQSIEANVNGQLAALEAVAARSDISDPNLDPVQKRDILKKEAERLNSISIVYVDEKGDSIGSDGKVYNVADRDYIAKALSGTRNIAGPNVRKTDNALSVRYVVPVRNGDKVIGALLESRDGNALSDYTDKIKFGTTGSGFLINNAGTTIAHKNRDKVLNQENIIKASEKDASLSSFADVYKTMIKRESGMANFNYKDKEYYIGYSPVQGTDWALGVIIHKSEVLSELADLKIVATVSSVIVYIIGVILIYLLANMITKGIKAVSSHLNLLAQGDLTNDVPERYLSYKDEIGQMTKSMQHMQESLKEMIGSVKRSASDVSDNSANLSATAGEIANASQNVTDSIASVTHGTGIQTENITNIIHILNDFGDKLSDMVGDIDGVNTNSKQIGDMAQDSNAEMIELNNSIDHISDMFKEFSMKISSLGKNINEINEITSLINDIAEQTNLLALNAAIEAARAGEAGKGFAVVADEIRTLAVQSKDSAEKISSLIGDISSETEVIVSDSETMDTELKNQVNIVENSIKSFVKIVNGVDDIIPKIDKVKVSAEDIENNKNAIIGKINELSAVSQEVAASSEEISAASEEMNASTEEVASAAQSLNDMTDNMMNEVNKFKL